MKPFFLDDNYGLSYRHSFFVPTFSSSFFFSFLYFSFKANFSLFLTLSFLFHSFTFTTSVGRGAFGNDRKYYTLGQLSFEASMKPVQAAGKNFNNYYAQRRPLFAYTSLFYFYFYFTFFLFSLLFFLFIWKASFALRYSSVQAVCAGNFLLLQTKPFRTGTKGSYQDGHRPILT